MVLNKSSEHARSPAKVPGLDEAAFMTNMTKTSVSIAQLSKAIQEQMDGTMNCETKKDSTLPQQPIPMVLFPPLHIIIILLLLIPLYIYVMPPKLEQLKVSHVRLIDYKYDQLNVKMMATFSGIDSPKFKCSPNSFKQQKMDICALKLESAFLNGDELVIWHDAEAIYQIKDGNQFLLNYSAMKEGGYTSFIVDAMLLIAAYFVFMIFAADRADNFKKKIHSFT